MNRGFVKYTTRFELQRVETVEKDDTFKYNNTIINLN